MTINLGGIGEGTFAFFIILCTLIGMATGAYLMDRVTFISYVQNRWKVVRRILQNLPATLPCIVNRHDWSQKRVEMLESGELVFDRCSRCKHSNLVDIHIYERNSL